MLGDVKQIKQMIQDNIRGVHTSIPGKITSVDSANNTVCIQPSGKFRKADGSYIDYPELKDVPMVQMQGAGQKATIQYPIKKGDGCMVFFSEQQLEPWKNDGQEPNTELRHDLTNAIAVPGLCPDANNVHTDSCDNDAIIIQYGDDTKITAKTDSVEIKQKDVTIVLEGGQVKIKAPSDVVIEGNVEITKGNLTLDQGNVSVTGGVSVTKDVCSPTVSLNMHVHASAAPGSPTPPTPMPTGAGT